MWLASLANVVRWDFQPLCIWFGFFGGLKSKRSSGFALVAQAEPGVNDVSLLTGKTTLNGNSRCLACGKIRRREFSLSPLAMSCSKVASFSLLFSNSRRPPTSQLLPTTMLEMTSSVHTLVILRVWSEASFNILHIRQHQGDWILSH